MMRAQARLWWGALAVVLLAINLRPGATSLGPVLAEVQAGLGMDAALAGLLTALPGLAFAVFGVIAVSIGLRLGLAGGLFLAALATAAGLLARTFVGSVPVFFALTLVAFAGMAIGNVLVPAYIKSHYPNRVAGLMSAYTISLAIGATASTLISAPLSDIAPGGWRAALGVWGLSALLASVPWAVLAASERRRRLAEVAVTSRPSGSVFGVVGSRRAVALALFFGMQSMQAYVQFGWVAQMLRDGGLSATAAGAAASLLAAFGLVGGLVMPLVVARVRDPRWVVVLLGVLLAAGWLGVWLAPAAAPWLWASLLGLSGFAFPMALALVTARTHDPHVTTQVSGFIQSVGYLFSAVGPLLVGVLFEVTGGWTVPLWFLLGSVVVFVASGVVAAAPGLVDDDLAARRG